MKRFLVLGLVTAGVASCGGDERAPLLIEGGSGGRRAEVPGRAGATSRPNPEPESEGGGGSGPRIDDDDDTDAGSGGDAASLELTITSPEPVSNPAAPDAPVLVAGEIEVVCSAESSGPAPIREDSVTIELLDGAGASLAEETAGPTGEPHEYSATFVLSDVPSGAVSLRCSARDTADPPRTAESVIETFFDGGAKISVHEPVAGSSKSARTAIPVSFVVEPTPLTEDDPGAEIADVVLVVQGQEIATSASGNVYSAVLHLNDTGQFPVTPTDEVAVGIRVTNARGTESRHDYRFQIDSLGPEIAITTPAEHAVIGSQAGPLVFRVTDDRSGVDQASIAVFIDGDEHRYDGSAAWKIDGNAFSYFYDWAELGKQQSQVTVTVRALDVAGNAAPGASVVYYVDNIPPYVSLDPPTLREIRAETPKPRISRPFDPVGPASANDGDRFVGRSEAGQLLTHVRFRAFVRDRTNEAPGQTLFYLAGTNPTSVRLYLQANPAAGFLTDLNRDGACDDIQSVSDFAAFQRLTALSPTGNPPGDSIQPDEDPIVLNDEDYNPFVASYPALCNLTSDMTRVLGTSGASGSLIYALAPGAGPACTGVQWELDNRLAPTEGWVCLAAVAEDAVGNRDVSAPLRICLSDGVAPEPACAGIADRDARLAGAPSCTDGCDPLEYSAPNVPYAVRALDVSR